MLVLTIKDERVFDALVSGEKKYEGRKWKEEYSVKPGDRAVFFLEGALEFLVTRITDVRRFSTIKEMVDALYKDLIPWARSPEEALEVYKQFYSPNDPAVALGIQPLLHVRVDDRRTLEKILGVRLPNAVAGRRNLRDLLGRTLKNTSTNT